mgnify:CR=1 FL=1
MTLFTTASLINDACFLSGLRQIQTIDTQGELQEPWRPKFLYHFIQEKMLKMQWNWEGTLLRNGSAAALGSR